MMGPRGVLHLSLEAGSNLHYRHTYKFIRTTYESSGPAPMAYFLAPAAGEVGQVPLYPPSKRHRIGRQWRADKQQPSIGFLISQYPSPCSPKLTILGCNVTSLTPATSKHWLHRIRVIQPRNSLPWNPIMYLPGERCTAVPPNGGAQGVQR